MANSPGNVSSTGFPAFSAQTHYKQWIDGTYGQFVTPAGTIHYLETKARLAGDSSCYTDLTKFLVPAREALEIRQMNFNQLLQRDLDDHRIAKDLLEYVLRPPVTGLPGFFPPIVAILLPFDSQERPVDAFPVPTAPNVETDHQFGMEFHNVTYGNAFRTQFLAADKQNLNRIPYGVIRWNPEHTKLVIMDGQHRAMALLAIERTVNNSWNASRKGARYEPFYRERVRSLLAAAKSAAAEVNLNQIEQPVTICWFPDAANEAIRPQPHKAARKLFVDVNNTAKPPSRSRLVLLSDTELENVFARELLNKLRDAEWEDRLPLYAVEYDNPRENMTTPRRWSVVSNLEILKACVVRAVFGPEQIINKMDYSLSGRPNWRDMDDFMRKQLCVGELFPKHFADGPRPMERDRLGHEYFPINDDELRRKLIAAFYEKWGSGILSLLSAVAPYAAHIRAIKDRFSGWTPGNNIADLAKDALFEGVGMFWTLENEHDLWERLKADSPDASGQPAQSDSSRAWVLLRDEQRRLFRERRAEVYLGASDDASLNDCDALFNTLNTYAAQVGLVLAWVSAHRHCPNISPSEFAEIFIRCINRALESGPNASRDRRKFFLKSASKAINNLPKLDQPFAVYFRYFWLELLLIAENDSDLEQASIALQDVKKLRDDARTHYLKSLVDERTRDVLRTHPDIRNLPEGEQRGAARERAIDLIVEEQAEAHKHWFAVPMNDARAMIRNSFAKPIPESSTADHVSEADESLGNQLAADAIDNPEGSEDSDPAIQ
jgi:hypothetical protein